MNLYRLQNINCCWWLGVVRVFVAAAAIGGRLVAIGVENKLLSMYIKYLYLYSKYKWWPREDIHDRRVSNQIETYFGSMMVAFKCIT